jgi:hypothetical protein
MKHTKNIAKKKTCPFSVADPGCLSRIPDPDFYAIPYLTTATKDKG